MCRHLLTLYALSLAVGCLIGLALANRLLMMADAQQEAARKRLSRDTEDVTRETAWLIRDTAEKGLVFERDGGSMMYLPERN